MRKVLLFFLIISCLSLQSCFFSIEYPLFPLEEDPGYPIEKKDVAIYDEYLPYTLEYENEMYYAWDQSLTPKSEEWLKENEFVLVSWYHSSFLIIYSYGSLYAPSTTSPPFIVRPDSTIFINESFDYKQEIFVLEGTGVELVFSDAYAENSINIGNLSISEYPKKEYRWTCKKYSTLETNITVFQMDNAYYVQIGKPNVGPFLTYPISSEFLALLEENDLLPEAEVIPQS